MTTIKLPIPVEYRSCIWEKPNNGITPPLFLGSSLSYICNLLLTVRIYNLEYNLKTSSHMYIESKRDNIEKYPH